MSASKLRAQSFAKKMPNKFLRHRRFVGGDVGDVYAKNIVTMLYALGFIAVRSYLDSPIHRSAPFLRHAAHAAYTTY